MFTFGPVNSRRFGISLGIDLSPDAKSCNFDCVYCELKGAKPVYSIKTPPKVQDIVDEVKKAIKTYHDIEVITITSNGEPTLYHDIKKLVDELNKIKQDKKLLILSNGSNIVDALYDIDIVKLSLDCVSQRCFKKIDRPLKDLDIDKIVKNIKDFSTKYQGTLIIEVLLVKGINDKEDEIIKLNQLLQEINPSRVDIGTIDRPPAYEVKPVSEERIKELSNLFTNLPISIIYKNPPKSKEDFSKEQILNLLAHRPQSQFDVDTFFSEKSKQILQKLVDDGEVNVVDVAGSKFFKKLSS